MAKSNIDINNPTNQYPTIKSIRDNFIQAKNDHDILDDLVQDINNNLSNRQGILGSYFGFSQGTDCTEAFINYSDYLISTKPSQQKELLLTAGVYNFEGWDILGWDGSSSDGENLVPSPRIRGEGKSATILNVIPSPRRSAIKLGRGPVHNLMLTNMSIKGNSNNIGQHGIELVAKLGGNPLNKTGGILQGNLFENLRISGFSGHQMISKGASIAGTGVGVDG